MWKSKRDKPKWIVVGEVVASWGNRGEVKIIAQVPDTGRWRRLLFPGTATEPVGSFRSAGDTKRPASQAQDVDSIDQAEKARGMLIKVSVDELMPLPPGRCPSSGSSRVRTESERWGGHRCPRQGRDVYVVKPYKE